MSLQKYLDQLAPGKSSGAVAITVRMALMDRAVFFYGQLLSNDLVKSTIGTGASADHAALFEALRILTHGVLRDLSQSSASSGARDLIRGSPELTAKLRQLTLLSIAETSKSIPYDVLASELEIGGAGAAVSSDAAAASSASASATRELEDIVIDSTTAGLLTVTLNPQKRLVQVHDAAARDVDLSEVPKLLEIFESWGARCEAVTAQLADTQRRVDASEAAETQRVMQFAYTEDVERKKALRAIVESGAAKEAKMTALQG